jgi:WD40 repeat protein
MWRTVLPLLVLVGIPPSAPAQSDAPAPRTDPEGVPLPAAAVARLGSTRFWHRDVIQPLAFAPDGRTLFVGTVSHDALYAWDAATGRLRWRATFAERSWSEAPAARSLAPRDIGFVGADVAVVLPDGQGREGVVRFEQATGRETGRVPLVPQPLVDQYRFSRDGSRVAVSHEQDLAVHDTATGRQFFARRAEYRISPQEGLDFSPDGKLLAVGDCSGGVHFLRADTGQPVRDGAAEGSSSLIGVRFAADGQTVLARPTTTAFRPMLLLDAATGAVRHQLQTAGEGWSAWSCAFAPGGARLFTACRVYPDGGGLADLVVTWDVVTGRELNRFPCAAPNHMAVSPDGRVLATADWCCVELLDLATGRPLAQSADPIGGYEEVRQRPDGRWVGLASESLDTFDGTGRRLGRLVPKGPPGEVAWWGSLSPDGTRLARYRRAVRGERCGPVQTWDTAAGSLLATFGREESREPVPWDSRQGHAVQGFSPDGKAIYTRRSDSGPGAAWDTATGKPVERPPWLAAKVRPAAVSLDGRWIAERVEVPGVAFAALGVQSIPTGIRIVEAATGRGVVTLNVSPPRVHSVAFSPDGETVAVVPDHETDIINRRPPISQDLVYLFRVPSGREIGRLRGPDGSADRVAFAPDGRSVATTSLARTARVWEVATLGVRQSFPHARLARWISFSRDGRELAIDGEDAPVCLWDVYGDRTRTGPKPDAAALDRAWADLANGDPGAGFRAVRALVAAPDDAVRLLRDRLKPDPGPGSAAIRRWVADLDSPEFATRQKATAALTAAVEFAEPVLREALAGAPSVEARRRMKVILSVDRGQTPGALRAARGVEVLGVIGTPDARSLLSELAHGPAGDRLTVEAKRTIERAGGR